MGLLIAAVAVFLVSVLRWVLQFWSTKLWLRKTTIPGPPVPNMLLGHVGCLLSERAPFIFAEWGNTHGPIYKLQINAQPCVVVSDQAAIQQLIRSDKSPDYITKDPAIYSALERATRPALHNILTSADGPYWKAVRSGTAPCFSISNLKQAFPWIQELCGKAVRHISSVQDPAAEVDVVDLSKRFTSDIMGSMLLNQDLGGMDMGPNEYVDIFGAVVEEVHKHMANPLRPLMFWSSGRAVLRRHDKIIADKVREMLDQPPPDYSVAGHLLKVIDPATAKPLTQAQLKAELAMFFGAGFETTSHAISWTLMLLATHPDVQQALVAELAAAGLALGPGTTGAAGGGAPRRLQWQDLSQLPYLAAVCKESLRCFAPPAMGSFRVCHRDGIQVLGHSLPKGTMVIISPYVLGCSRQLFGESAESFLPERWLDQQQLQRLQQLKGAAAVVSGSAGAQSPPASDGLPFSSGPRDCQGQALATLEMKAFLATLVGHFEVQPGQVLAQKLAAAAAAAAAPGSRTAAVKLLKERAFYHVTLQPASGVPFLKLKLRY